ncbi:phosphoadenosine phosphosulfate reductase domain-containing protein [Flavobacterium psychrophilum]
MIDWKYTDVWKYLIENSLKYNRVYDKMYMQTE